jgi:hypothetical protein
MTDQTKQKSCKDCKRWGGGLKKGEPAAALRWCDFYLRLMPANAGSKCPTFKPNNN